MNSNSVVWDAAEVAGGLDTTARLRPTLLAHLKALLDDYHGTARPVEYYDLIAGMWLESLAHNVYTAWREVLGGNVPTDLGPIPLIRNTKQAHAMMADVGWHRHLRSAVSRLLEGQSPANWAAASDSAYAEGKIRHRAIRKGLRSISTSKPRILLTQPNFKCPYSEWMAALWRWRQWIALDDMQYPVASTAGPDWNWRKRHSADTCKPVGNFGELVTTLLPLYIPVDLLEGFQESRAAALALSLPRPQAVFSANALHAHPAFQTLLAEWRQEGTQLLYQQHGGGYGLDPQLVVEQYEIRVSDRFYSWGWRRQGAPVYPLSPAMPAAKRGSRGKHVLLNCVDLPRMPFRMSFAPMPGTIEIMHRNTREFLADFPDRSRLVVRPYPVDYGWGAVEAMRKQAPEARFESGRGQFSLYFASRLVVHGYLGTGWLETLGLNVPTIVFYNPAVYIYRDETRPVMDALQRVGILHHSGKDAARFIASLGNDIEGWWGKSEVQAARRDFVQHYANFSPDWASHWAREFEAVLDGSTRQ